MMFLCLHVNRVYFIGSKSANACLHLQIDYYMTCNKVSKFYSNQPVIVLAVPAKRFHIAIAYCKMLLVATIAKEVRYFW